MYIYFYTGGRERESVKAEMWEKVKEIKGILRGRARPEKKC